MMGFPLSQSRRLTPPCPVVPMLSTSNLLLSLLLLRLVQLLKGVSLEQEQLNCRATTFRIDCHPEPNANELECQRRKCCWVSANESQHEQQLERPLVNQPSCFFPPNYSCYEIKSIRTNALGQEDDSNEDSEIYSELRMEVEEENEGQQDSPSATVIKWLLVRRDDCPASGFPNDAKRIEIELKVHDETLINIKISEPDKTRFKPKLPEINLPTGKANKKVYVFYDDDSDYVKAGNRIIRINGQRQKILVELANKPATLVSGSSGSAQSTLDPATDPCCMLKVIHQVSGAILFEMDLSKLIYSRQFIQLPTYLPSPHIYGLGQHLGDSLLKTSGGHYARSYTMFNYGHPPLTDGRSAYSSYPFYINLAQLSDSNNNTVSNTTDYSIWELSERARRLMATGALMLNSNAMDLLVHSVEATDGNGGGREGKGAGLTWRLVGGFIDLYLFLGPKPHDVIGQYQALVGKPMLPPAWSLGYHQSRLNYRELMPIKHAWGRTRTLGIPMESFWTDLEFMWRTTSYSLNNPELNELVKILQNKFEMHYVPVVDPTISVREDSELYKPLKLAKDMDILVKMPIKFNSSVNDLTLAIVTQWTESKQAGLIDFTNPKAIDYLREVLANYREQLNFDGLWLDMNEPEVFENQVLDQDGQACSLDDKLKYQPGSRNLNDRTLCMSAQFYAGKHSDIHNLFAFYQSKAHFEALKLLDPARRPFLISRAQFVGQGKYSGTWLGDMGSTFEHLRWSMLGTIESNWFGQPLVGADICGFFGSTSEELCARWFSLGAFYPFARNHNDAASREQDPGSLNDTVQKAARVALMRRYSMLPYLYTLFYENHLTGTPVIRSILFEIFEQLLETEDLMNLPQIDDEFMWGSSILLAPVVHQGVDSRSVFLPTGRWYDISIGLPGLADNEGPYDALNSNWPVSDESQTINGTVRDRLDGLRKPIDCTNKIGCWLNNQYTPLGSMNIYQRGGHIIPTFRHFDHTKGINMLWREASFFLEVALDSENRASGSLFMDNGESEPEDRLYSMANFRASNSQLIISVSKDNSGEPLKFDGFIVYGVGSLKQLPESKEYRDSKLEYRYYEDTQTLSCLFVGPSSDPEIQPLALGKFESVLFNWRPDDEEQSQAESLPPSSSRAEASI